MKTQSSPIRITDADPELCKFASALGDLLENFHTPYVLTECLLGFLNDVAPQHFPAHLIELKGTHIAEAQRIRSLVPQLAKELEEYEIRENEQAEIDLRIRAAGGHAAVFERMISNPKIAPQLASVMIEMLS
jgi:hypothetical protein